MLVLLQYLTGFAVSQQLYRILQSLSWEPPCCKSRHRNSFTETCLVIRSVVSKLLEREQKESRDDDGYSDRTDLVLGDDCHGSSSSDR